MDSLGTLDPYLDSPVRVNTQALLNMVTQCDISIKECALITYLSEKVQGWNYYIGRISDMSHIISNPKNLGTVLKSLEERGFIRTLHKGFFYKDSVVVQVSPFYTWKGNIANRESAILRWYGAKDYTN